MLYGLSRANWGGLIAPGSPGRRGAIIDPEPRRDPMPCLNLGKPLLVAAIVVVAWLVFVQVPRLQWSLKSSPAGAEADTPVLAATGGAVWLWYVFGGRATWPFVRIEIYEWGLRITPKHFVMRWYIPSAEVPFDRLSPSEPAAPESSFVPLTGRADLSASGHMDFCCSRSRRRSGSLSTIQRPSPTTVHEGAGPCQEVPIVFRSWTLRRRPEESARR